MGTKDDGQTKAIFIMVVSNYFSTLWMSRYVRLNRYNIYLKDIKLYKQVIVISEEKVYSQSFNEQKMICLIYIIVLF